MSAKPKKFTGRANWMIKILAFLFIISGCTAAGVFASSYCIKRAEILSTVILMINAIETQLRYACLPVSDLLRVLADNPAFSQLGFIKCTREKICFGESFPDAWKESVESEAEVCRVLSGSAQHLFALGTEIGSTDLEGQLSCCEYYKDIFSKELEIQQEKNRRYSRLFPPLGLLVGISAAILMI